jgi:DNA polymerase III delta prime subunit
MLRKENTLWVEKYRPSTLNSYIGNSDVISKIQSFIDSNDVPHLLLCGKAGTGKTTLAKIITNAINCDCLYINASDKGGVEFVRTDLIPFASSAGFNDLKIVILDEADFITPNAQAALRNAMETFSKHCRFILTCNYVEKIIDPIQSRCQVFQITPPSKKDVAVRMVEILNEQGIEYAKEDLVLVVNNTYPDIRRAINSLQQQSNTGTLTIDKKTVIESNYQLKLLELLKLQDKKKAFSDIRKILSDASQNDFTSLYSFLYENIDEFAQGHIASVILILAEAQYTDPSAVDKELHVASMFVKLLNELG